MQYSKVTQRKFADAFDALFTTPMTIVVHVDGGRDWEVRVSGELQACEWRSPPFVASAEPDERHAEVVAMSVVNDRGELVADWLVDPPIDLDIDPGEEIYFEGPSTALIFPQFLRDRGYGDGQSGGDGQFVASEPDGIQPGR